MKQRTRDRIRGSLMAGAAGDALGYTVEFMSRNSILAQYGNRGITEFDLDNEGKALISDDTQMTLFTANGMLMGVTRGCMRGIGGNPEDYVEGAYLDWYYTQTGKKKNLLTRISTIHGFAICPNWLIVVPQAPLACRLAKVCIKAKRYKTTARDVAVSCASLPWLCSWPVIGVVAFRSTT